MISHINAPFEPVPLVLLAILQIAEALNKMVMPSGTQVLARWVLYGSTLVVAMAVGLNDGPS